MSKIDKLSILGIRSFDNTRSETIAFHTPLTLIVGHNGSGKTTIIECLKYITTGEQPPGSKTGGAFIHDPKLCGEKEVLAQVKLSFRNVQGAKLVATRSMQLTVKKATRSLKALDGTLLLMREGEKSVLSSRVAELNSAIPKYLGVSKAILDSVIFCHQDDSLWPLSEPSKLKQRFDDIFEASKYSKAIDNIKALQKRQKEELGKLKIIEEQAKVDKDRGEKARKQMISLESQIDDLREKATGLKTLMKEALLKAEESWKQMEAANLIVGSLTGKRIEQRTKDESVQSLRVNLVEMTDSDEALQTMLEQYEERVEAYEENLGDLQEHYGEYVGKINESRDRVIAKERECGQYEAEKQSYDRQLENREKLVKEIARSHKIRGFDLEVNNEQVRAFMERISQMARDQNAAFERARRETQEELQAAQKVLNEINEKRSALNQRKENARSQISNNDRKIANLQSNLNKINIDEGGKVALESNRKDINERLQTAKSELSASDWKTKLEAAETEQRKLDVRKEKLETEMVEGTRQAGDSARLDFVQKELRTRQSSLETMIGAHSDSIGKVVGQSWKPESVDADFARVVDDASRTAGEAERQRDGTSREKDQVDFKLNTCRTELKAKTKELKDCTAKIKEAVDCEPDEYTDEVQKMETGRDVLKSDHDTFTRMREYFLKCVETAQSRNACLTCKRGFKSDKDCNGFVSDLQKELLKYKTEETREELRSIEEDLKSARAVGTDFDLWERLKEKEIPALEAEQKKLNARRDALISQLEEQDRVVDELNASKRDIESLSKTVQTIAKYVAEVKTFESQIKELAAKQKNAGLSRGLEMVQEDIKKVNDEARTLKTSLNRLTSDRDRAQKLINSLELESRDVASKLSTAVYQLKEKLALEGQIDELKTSNAEQRDGMRSTDQDLQGLVPQLSQAQAKYDDISRRGADRDRELQTEANKLNGSLNQLKMANQEVTAYIDRSGPQQLARGKHEVESLKEEVSRLETEQQRVVREVKQLEKNLQSHSDTKRSISDNQHYRRDLRQLETVREEIAELETHNAEEDKLRHEREGSRSQMERNKLAAEQASVIGQLKGKDDQLQMLMKDYDTEYKDAAYKYKESHVKVETTKAAIEDLGRYGGALDKAIMKYHGLKMEEINRIVEELWRKTYQGTDVDSILIRSESEIAGKSNKSYNYRVCMVKQDAEMDMRGRCSAGQKVLACIIIRLALAECFGTNCGIIALDEPTTNLDRDNIRALAESLAEIIRVRRQQRNFQLIVITHDEEFLRYMNCSDFADVYYRISRNEAQKSTIERQSIAEVV